MWPAVCLNDAQVEGLKTAKGFDGIFQIKKEGEKRKKDSSVKRVVTITRSVARLQD